MSSSNNETNLVINEQEENSGSGPWKEFEDKLCISAVENEVKSTAGAWKTLLDTNKLPEKFSWVSVSDVVKTRNSKQCRERWLNHLAPTINRDPFTSEEDARLIYLFGLYPRCWTLLARELNRRTQAQIRQRWRALQRTKNSFYSYDGRQAPIQLQPSMQRSTSTPEMFGGTISFEVEEGDLDCLFEEPPVYTSFPESPIQSLHRFPFNRHANDQYNLQHQSKRSKPSVDEEFTETQTELINRYIGEVPNDSPSKQLKPNIETSSTEDRK